GGRPGRLDGVMAGTGVTRSHRHDHVGTVEVVDRDGQKVLVARYARFPVRAAQTHVGDVEPVGIGGVERIQDGLGARVVDVTGKDVVVAEKGARSDARNRVGDCDAIDIRRRAVVAGDSPGNVRTVGLLRFGGVVPARCLVVEYFGDDDL